MRKKEWKGGEDRTEKRGTFVRRYPASGGELLVLVLVTPKIESKRSKRDEDGRREREGKEGEEGKERGGEEGEDILFYEEGSCLLEFLLEVDEFELLVVIAGLEVDEAEVEISHLVVQSAVLLFQLLDHLHPQISGIIEGGEGRGVGWRGGEQTSSGNITPCQ